jgi:hypothetical protein
MLSCAGDHILQEFNTMFDKIQNLQNCYTTPNKNLGGEGGSDRLTPTAKSPFTNQFFIWSDQR